MNCSSSSYSHYIALREQIIGNDEKLNCFELSLHYGPTFILSQIGVRVHFLERKLELAAKLLFQPKSFLKF